MLNNSQKVQILSLYLFVSAQSQEKDKQLKIPNFVDAGLRTMLTFSAPAFDKMACLNVIQMIISDGRFEISQMLFDQLKSRVMEDLQIKYKKIDILCFMNLNPSKQFEKQRENCFKEIMTQIRSPDLSVQLHVLNALELYLNMFSASKITVKNHKVLTFILLQKMKQVVLS